MLDCITIELRGSEFHFYSEDQPNHLYGQFVHFTESVHNGSFVFLWSYLVLQTDTQ